MLPALLAAGSLGSLAQSGSAPSPAANGNAAPANVAYRQRPHHLTQRANNYYGLVWGVDTLSVKWMESGELIRFSYRVVDPEQAKVLSDKKAEPHLDAPAAGVSLVVPTLDKVGQLRQSSTPIEGRSYWVAFSNRGRRVKRGDQVDVVIGSFRARGLIVE